MSDKATGPAGAAGTAPTADQPSKIRNVVLVGHSGAGKTTLVEALLVATGTIPRAGRVEDGTTTTDFEDAEVRHQRSVSLALAPVEHDGVKINLLDAPGYADFVGDLRAGLRAADAALFVMSAVDGIDGSTRMLWEECAQVGHATCGRHHETRLTASRLRSGRRCMSGDLRQWRAAVVRAGPSSRRRDDGIAGIA